MFGNTRQSIQQARRRQMLIEPISCFTSRVCVTVDIDWANLRQWYGFRPVIAQDTFAGLKLLAHAVFLITTKTDDPILGLPFVEINVAGGTSWAATPHYHNSPVGWTTEFYEV